MNPDDWKLFPVSHYNPDMEMTIGLLKARILNYRSEIDTLKAADQSLYNVVRFLASTTCHQCDKQRLAREALESYWKAKGKRD